MKRLVLLLVVLGVAGPPWMAISFHESPDVPTDLVGLTYLPRDVVRNDSGTYSLAMSFPPSTPVDALHQMCSGDWLLSVEVPTQLVAVAAEARDVVRFDGINYSPFFCGGPVGIPGGSVVDAAFLVGGDQGDLVLSFDVPTDLSAIGGNVYDPADLVRFTSTGSACSNWSVAFVPFFDASAASPPVLPSANVTGADERGGLTILTFDVPTDLGGPTNLPGELVSWNGASFALFHASASWPISSRADAVTMLPAPGTVPATGPNVLILGKPAGFPPQIYLQWGPSTSAGATDYGIYEGTIGSWYSHTAKVCTDTGGDLQEIITPQIVSSYYLVVPLNANDEGSYGLDSAAVERPVGTATCVSTQALGCP